MEKENAKQKAIEVAYGKLYDKSIDENGWAYYQLNEERQIIKGISPGGMSLEFNNFKQDNANLIFYWRPKSLQGIENNNSWSQVPSIHEKEIEKGQYWVVYKNGFIEVAYYDGTMDCYKFWKLNFTHYQPIIKPEKPHY